VANMPEDSYWMQAKYKAGYGEETKWAE